MPVCDAKKLKFILKKLTALSNTISLGCYNYCITQSDNKIGVTFVIQLKY